MQLFRALTLSVLLAMSLCACPGDPDPTPDAGAPDAGEPDAGPGDAGPVLSEVPLWEVKHDPEYTAGCFGRSVALGDLNGDGQKDLVVATSPCLTTTREPGRVSIFPGEAPFFSKQAVTTVMNWRNTHMRTSGNQMVVSTGNVDGDAYADVLVSGQYGQLVFKGQADLGQVFTAPLFLVPGGGIYNNAVLADVDGDGLDDLVSVRQTELAVYRATPGAQTGPFTRVPRTQDLFTISVRRAGDFNGDGAQDIVTNGSAFGLFLGCKAGGTQECDGLLSKGAAWSVDTQTLGLLADLNGDGKPERFQGPGGGTQQLHLPDARSPTGFAPTPVWTVMADPLFTRLGNTVVSVGDMDGDGQRNDFVMGSDGRLYFFSPAQGVSAELKPAWAWQRADRLPSGYAGFHRFSVVAPGDLDRNGFDDLVVGLAPPAGLVSGPAGRVAIYGGGTVPSEPAAPPHLPAVAACGLPLAPENGKPDLTVDADVLARSLYVERRTFAADACEVIEGCVPAEGQRRLLRFSTSIVNLGSAQALVPNKEERPDLYVYDACHGHDHLTNFARYSLRGMQGQEVVEGRKQGFYLVDYHRQCSDAAPYFLYGERMGISAGWSDVYVADIPCQWIDITGLTDGTYSLRVGVDEQDIIEEASTHPNEATLNVRIQEDSVTVLP